MEVPATTVLSLLRQISSIISDLTQVSSQARPVLEEVRPDYRASAESLLQYATFRRYDWRTLQQELRALGLAGLAHSGSDLLSSLKRTYYLLSRLLPVDSEFVPSEELSAAPSRRRGKTLLGEHTVALLGEANPARRVRIMVTMPREAAWDYALVKRMLNSGMDVVRINCAHDEPVIWEAIIANVRQASEELGRVTKISMDLAGPKIRTGPMEPGAEVLKFKPERDDYGRVIRPTTIRLVAATNEKPLEPNTLPIIGSDWLKLVVNDELRTNDTRGRSRRLRVAAVEQDAVVLECRKTVYFQSGQKLYAKRAEIDCLQVGTLPALAQYILLQQGDRLRITQAPILGRATDDQQLRLAHISCTLPEVFSCIRMGEPVLFDDGKIEGIVEEVATEEFVVRITRTKAGGGKLKAEKGMNFPQTALHLNGLTDKDRQDLRFIAQHADLVNFSFVQNESDVRDLVMELQDLGVDNSLNVVLKIETRRGYENLVDILLAAMRIKYVGVMIARGDLAVEVGWKDLSRVQEEILALCTAAHIPVVWATQVFESLAKDGLPSRPEITDAATSLKAECVMLNKGPYIHRAIALLGELLQDMEDLHEKNLDMLPALV